MGSHTTTRMRRPLGGVVCVIAVLLEVLPGGAGAAGRSVCDAMPGFVPGERVGAIRLGMTLAQVVAVAGRPAPLVDWGRKRLPVTPWNPSAYRGWITYGFPAGPNRGIGFTVDASAHVMDIAIVDDSGPAQCWRGAPIALGASLSAVARSYGTPDTWCLMPVPLEVFPCHHHATWNYNARGILVYFVAPDCHDRVGGVIIFRPGTACRLPDILAVESTP